MVERLLAGFDRLLRLISSQQVLDHVGDRSRPGDADRLGRASPSASRRWVERRSEIRRARKEVAKVEPQIDAALLSRLFGSCPRATRACSKHATAIPVAGAAPLPPRLVE